MKHIALLFTLLVSPLAIYSQNIQFEDLELKRYLINENCVDTNNNNTRTISLDFNNDGEIQISEALIINNLFIETNVNTYKIKVFNDLQYFKNLRRLTILASINSFKAPFLEKLEMITITDDDIITDIDLSSLPNLSEIYLEGLTNIKNVNLKNGSSAETLSLFYSFPKSVCIDSLQKEYNDVLYWVGNDSSKVSMSCLVNSISNLHNVEIKLHPNPANTKLHLTMDKSIKIKSYAILDSSGKEIRSTILKGDSIDIEALDSGQYILVLQTNKGSITRPFMKN